MNSLSKGLIFYCALDERSGTQDLVSEVVGTGTAVYPVLDKSGSGRRWLEYNGTSSYTILSSPPSFTSADLTAIVKFKTGNSVTGAYSIVWKGGMINNNRAFTLQIYDGILYFQITKTEGGYYNPNLPISTNTEYTAICVISGNVMSLQLNATSATPVTFSGTRYVGSESLEIGKNTNGSYFNGSITMCHIFNYSLSAQQVANYSKPEYAIEWVDRGVVPYVGTSKTWTAQDGSSWFIGYSIAKLNTYALFTYTISENTSNASSIQLSSHDYGPGGIHIGNTTLNKTVGTHSYLVLCNGTLGATPRSRIDIECMGLTTGSLTISSINIAQLGAILDLNAEGMASATWVDKTNSLTATNSGTTYVCPSASNMKASYFNGSTSKVAWATHNVNQIGTGDFTISWRVNQLKLATDPGYMNYFSLYSTGDNGEFDFASRSNGVYYFYIRSGGVSNNIMSASAANASNYLNLETTYIVVRRSGVVNVYINGVKVAADVPCPQTINSTVPLEIGLRNTVSPFSGNEKTVFVLSRAVTADEIAFINAAN